MEFPNAGRWTVAALLAGCVVLGTMLILRDDDDPPPRSTSSQLAAERRPDAVPGLQRVAPVRRHAQAAAAGTVEKGGFAIVRVTESETGAPIRGASVGVPSMEDDPRVHGVTGADGVARMGPLASYEWPLLASAAGRIARPMKVLIEEGGETPIEIALDPAAALAVVAEDALGEAVELANIDAEPLGGGMHARERTDARGRAFLALPLDTVVRITAKADGFSEVETVVRTPVRGAAALPVTIRFARPGRLLGIVRDASGLPAAHAVVFVRPSHEAIRPESDVVNAFRLEPNAFRASSDERGRYSVTGLVAGRRYHAFAADPNASPRPASDVAENLVVAADPPELTRDFTISRPGLLVVRVTNPDGTIATDANVTTGSTTLYLDVARTPPVSLYVFARSETGVFAFAADGRYAHRRVTVPPGETVQLTMELGPAPEVSGFVIDDAGNPIAGATVHLTMDTTSTDASIRRNLVNSAADGSWRLPAPFAGACTVQALTLLPGLLPGSPVHVSAPSKNIRLRLPRSATVTLRLVPPGEGPHPRSACVRIGGTEVYDRRPEDDGSIRLDYDPALGDRMTIVFPPKSWRLPANPSADDFVTAYTEYAPIVRQLNPVAGKPEDLGDLPLQRPSTLRVRVVDSTAQAVGGARVRLEANWSSMLSYGTPPPTTDSAGTVAFPCAPAAGIVPLVVTAAGFLDRRVEVSSGGSEPPTITLFRGGLAWGEVVDAAGAPVADAVVNVTDARNVTTTVRADAHGVFGVRVEAGRWLLAADDGSPESAQLAEGGDTHVRLVAGAR